MSQFPNSEFVTEQVNQDGMRAEKYGVQQIDITHSWFLKTQGHIKLRQTSL